MSHRLFIVISDQLRARRYLSLTDTDTDVLVIPEGLLSIQKEPSENTPPCDVWETVVKGIIVNRIRSHAQWEKSRVRVAAHLRSCFGTLSDIGWRKDRRFPDKEAELLKELGVEVDLQIWGFHHESELSEIWTVLRQVKNVWKERTPEPKIEFLAMLEEAFERSHVLFVNASRSENKRAQWETLSLVKHEIVGLFDPLRMRLETAREIRQEEPSRAGVIEASVKASIGEKLTRAGKLLEECRVSVTGEQAADWFRQTREQLKNQPDLAEFPEWLHRLDDCLHNLRNSVKE